MKIARWYKPEVATFGRLADLREEIDRLFGSPLSGLARTNRWLSGWNPALDVREDKESFTVTVELPGMKKEDIQISLNDGAVSISGERKSEAEHKEAEVYRSERYFGRFQRSVSLPTSVAADKISAQYKDGVLTVTLPKAEEAKPKHIDINVH